MTIKNEMMEELLKITNKYDNNTAMPIFEIQSTILELHNCETLIPKRTKRITKDGRKINADGYEYNLSEYDKEVKKLQDDYKRIEPFIRGDFKLRIPQHPTKALQALDVFLTDYGYTKKDIRAIIKIINFYDVNISWSKKQKQLKERAEVIAEMFELKTSTIFESTL